MIEEYRPVKGYEGLYEVSNMGNVRSLPKMRGAFPQDALIKVHEITSCGYHRVRLHREKASHHAVHRLVAIAFIPNPMNLPQVDHIDGDKNNNCVSNLRWCTAKENTNYPITMARKKAKRQEVIKRPEYLEKMRSKYGKKVGMFDKLGNLIKTFRSAAEAERQLGYSVSPQCLGKYKSRYKGRNEYTFKYIDL